ncbi:hypothetical protein [Tardiphaga sp. 709]|uniref:hypothetical protein n=1 Tax=Tardiphaga sp. 709 TaxID=3076039 RepID=UPI0028E2E595|nr:hypothetical protein [Tardiphaga sp. 709]WNV10171.1 hypothetical protein RSO67_02960 [Tardiphaga sp. 709]
MDALVSTRLAERLEREASLNGAIAAELERQFESAGIALAPVPDVEMPADFVAWCDGIGLPSLPARPAAVALYLMSKSGDMLEQAKAISQVHRARGLSDPTAGAPVATVIYSRSDVKPPRSWSKERWGAFYELPFELQDYLIKRDAQVTAELRRAQSRAAIPKAEINNEIAKH